MTIKVTRRIEINGKIEEKSAEARMEDDRLMPVTSTEAASRALFESMIPPLATMQAELPPTWDTTADRAAYEAWKKVSGCSFSFRSMAGDDFFKCWNAALEWERTQNLKSHT